MSVEWQNCFAIHFILHHEALNFSSFCFGSMSYRESVRSKNVQMLLCGKYLPELTSNVSHSEDIKCWICKMNPRSMRNELLLCDYCVSGAVHPGCVDPPYSLVTLGKFGCPLCIDKVMAEHRNEYEQLMDLGILDLTQDDPKKSNHMLQERCAKITCYSANDIVMLMFLVRDNSSFSDDHLKAIQERLDEEHTLGSLRQKILDVCGCLKYEVDHDHHLIDMVIKHEANVYKKYTKGKMRDALSIFLALNVYQEDIGKESDDAVNTTILDSFFRNCIHNRYSREYIENKRFQCDFIDQRMRGTTIFNEDKYIEIDIAESKLEQIYHTLNPNLRNKVQEFFNFKQKDKKCALCHRRQVERCHEKDRKSLFLDTVRDRKLVGTTINVGTLLKYFILQHKKEPLWMLCTRCHKYWDGTFKSNHTPVEQRKRGTQKRKLNHVDCQGDSIETDLSPQKKRKANHEFVG